MKQITIIRPDSREQWLEVRRSGIGSSEVATIVGLNPYETPYQLWRRKTGIDPDKAENRAMHAGHLLEDAVARFWCDATGRSIIQRSAGDWIIRDNERPYLQVSPDRTYWLSESRCQSAKGILECKTTRKKIDANDIPLYWFTQVQYQLGVAGLQQGSLAWLTAANGFDFGYVDLNLVDDYYRWLVEEVQRFYVDYIEARQEPPCVNADDVIIKYARHADGKVCIADEAAMALYQQLLQARRDKADASERCEALENDLKMVMCDAEMLAYDGATIATWRAAKDGRRFDAAAFKADHPDMYDSYCKTTQGARRFCVKDIKL